MKKPPSKVAYFSRIAEIFSTGLAAQTVQNAKFSFTRILLMQDWIFRLGFFPTIYCNPPEKDSKLECSHVRWPEDIGNAISYLVVTMIKQNLRQSLESSLP